METVVTCYNMYSSAVERVNCLVSLILASSAVERVNCHVSLILASSAVERVNCHVSLILASTCYCYFDDKAHFLH